MSPLYTFGCKHCNDSFDLRMSFNSGSTTLCPECGEKAEKIFTPPMTVIFKGKGWRATTYEFGRDYFGLQKELKDVRSGQEKRRGSYEERLESQQVADESRDAQRQTEKSMTESVKKGEMPGPNGGGMPFGGHGHGH